MNGTATAGRFRFAYFTSRYDETVSFCRDLLGLPALDTRDHSIDGKAAEDESTLTVETLDDIADALGVTPCDLLRAVSNSEQGAAATVDSAGQQEPGIY